MIMSDYESFVGLCYHALLLVYLKKKSSIFEICVKHFKD